MTLLPITLGVGQKSDAGSGKSRLKIQSEKTFERDNYTCRFCGFRAEKFQRVVTFGKSNDDQSLVTACTFCEQCIALERSGITGVGHLIWLPEIEQAELNHIIRAVYVGRASKTPALVELATHALNGLVARRSEAKKRLGIDDPLLLATILHEALDDDEEKEAATKLAGVRLLPSEKHMMRSPQGDINYFPQIVQYWASPQGPYARWPAEKWPEFLKNATAKVGHA